MLLRLHCNNITSRIFWVEESHVVGNSLSFRFLDPRVFAFSKYTSRYNFKLKNKKAYWINSSWLVFYLEQNRLSKLPILACMRHSTKPGLEFSPPCSSLVSLWNQRPRKSLRKNTAKTGMLRDAPGLAGMPVLAGRFHLLISLCVAGGFLVEDALWLITQLMSSENLAFRVSHSGWRVAKVPCNIFCPWGVS